MKRFETSIGLQDEFPFGYLKGATVKEAIDHNVDFVYINQCVEYVLDASAIKYMLKALARKERSKR